MELALALNIIKFCALMGTALAIIFIIKELKDGLP